MLGQYGNGIIPATISTDVTFSTAIKIAGFNRIAIDVPDFANGVITATANVLVQVANTSTTSEFKNLVTLGEYSAGAGILKWEVPSGSGSKIVDCPVVGFNYMRVELSNTATANVTFTVHVMQ
jgi:hypothetical protein